MDANFQPAAKPKLAILPFNLQVEPYAAPLTAQAEKLDKTCDLALTNEPICRQKTLAIQTQPQLFTRAIGELNT